MSPERHRPGLVDENLWKGILRCKRIAGTRLPSAVGLVVAVILATGCSADPSLVGAGDDAAGRMDQGGGRAEGVRRPDPSIGSRIPEHAPTSHAASIEVPAPMAPLRIFLAIDDSGSMRHGHRFARGIEAIRGWARSIGRSAGITVELATASDHVSLVGTYGFGDGRGAPDFLDALAALETKRVSRTTFRTVDRELTDLVIAKTSAEEQAVVGVVTDGISDEPATDLTLADLGDRIVPIGPGLFLATSGSFPSLPHLGGAETGGRRVQSAPAGPRGSDLRRLLSSKVAFAQVPVLRRALPARLLGGYDPVRVHVALDNRGALAREIQLRALGAEGSSVEVDPPVVVVPGHGRAEATVVLAPSVLIDGAVRLTGEGPDGAVGQTLIRAELTRDSWLISNSGAIELLGTVMFSAALVLWFLGRRPLALVPAGEADPFVEMRRGDVVPVATFEAAFPVDVVVGRGLFGLHVETSGAPVAVDGVPLPPRVRTRYRLRGVLNAGGVTVVLDRASSGSPAFASLFPSLRSDLASPAVRPSSLAGPSDGLL
jgi:hypothetical protein